MSEQSQQPVQLSPEIQQQISILNARIQNLNLATIDVLREMDRAFKTMATMIATLQKEKAELQAKLEKHEKPKAEPQK
jgi:flagellar capping protein FliD